MTRILINWETDGNRWHGLMVLRELNQQRRYGGVYARKRSTKSDPSAAWRPTHLLSMEPLLDSNIVEQMRMQKSCKTGTRWNSLTTEYSRNLKTGSWACWAVDFSMDQVQTSIPAEGDTGAGRTTSERNWFSDLQKTKNTQFLDRTSFLDMSIRVHSTFSVKDTKASQVLKHRTTATHTDKKNICGNSSGSSVKLHPIHSEEWTVPDCCQENSPDETLEESWGDDTRMGLKLEYAHAHVAFTKPSALRNVVPHWGFDRPHASKGLWTECSGEDATIAMWAFTTVTLSRESKVAPSITAPGQWFSPCSPRREYGNLEGRWAWLQTPTNKVFDLRSLDKDTRNSKHQQWRTDHK